MAKVKKRFTTIDGLRGIAAMLVVFYHLYGNLKNEVSDWMPVILDTILSYGYLGVHIFFVISGFVIAYSIVNCKINGVFIIRFTLRRSVRLDPLYWTNIIIAIFLIYLSSVLFDELSDRSIPSTQKIIANFLYVQNLLGYGDIVSVYWTLCLEFQFYIFFVSILYIVNKLIRKNYNIEKKDFGKYNLVLFIIGILSLIDYYNIGYNFNIDGFFLPFWYEFYLGILIFWTYKRLVNPLWFYSFFLMVCILGIYFKDANTIACFLSAFFIYLSIMNIPFLPKLTSNIFQFLGKISYSLYLFHPIIGWRAISLFKRWLGPEINVAESIFMFLIGLVASLLSAYLMYKLVELPTLNFSKKIRKQ